MFVWRNNTYWYNFYTVNYTAENIPIDISYRIIINKFGRTKGHKNSLLEYHKYCCRQESLINTNNSGWKFKERQDICQVSKFSPKIFINCSSDFNIYICYICIYPYMHICIYIYVYIPPKRWKEVKLNFSFLEGGLDIGVTHSTVYGKDKK